MALPVLRHRVLTTFNAEAAGVKADAVVRMLLDQLKPDGCLTGNNIEVVKGAYEDPATLRPLGREFGFGHRLAH
jgi:FAD synthase